MRHKGDLARSASSCVGKAGVIADDLHRAFTINGDAPHDQRRKRRLTGCRFAQLHQSRILGKHPRLALDTPSKEPRREWNALPVFEYLHLP